MKSTNIGHRLVALIGAAALLASCTHLGPQTIPVDRFDYSTAVADSWKQQTLLNIVKLRYMDLPVFVDVASIVSGYSLETSGNALGQVSSDDAIQGNSVALGGSRKFTDRPTITYVPMTGERFLRGLITPIAPRNIFFMLQSGYAADFILGLTVESINGVRNRSTVGSTVRKADPEFVRLLGLLRDVQTAGALGMRVETDEQKGQTAVLFFQPENLPVEITEKVSEIEQVLGLNHGQRRYVIKYSPVRGEDDELAVNSRSMLQIMGAFASYMEVPESHLLDHSTYPTIDIPDSENRNRAVSIRSGVEKPEEAFASVFYRGHWFWIDEGDWGTKRALTAVMFFFTLADTGANENIPLITIPAQ